MYCRNCGKEIDDEAKACPFCGEIIEQNNIKKTSALAIIGFVLSVFCSPLGFLFSYWGFSRTRNKKYGGRGFAVAGIIISFIVSAVCYVGFIWLLVIHFQSLIG